MITNSNAAMISFKWLFALPEPSRAQPQSPNLTPAEIMAIRESSAAQGKSQEGSADDDGFLSAE
jgi:hypothetical protein